MTTFAYADTTNWEEWQKKYKYGALYIFPPRGVIEAVDLLRRTYDPRSAAYCQAHISLSEPLPRPLLESDSADLRAALSRVETFAIHYGPLRSFPPYPGVTYAIRPEGTFARLRTAVHSIPLFRETTLKQEQITPHMTIAEFITLERTEQLLNDLFESVREGSFVCKSIEYAIPNSAFYFERVLTIPLGHLGS